MTIEEAIKLYPGDKVKVNWGAKQYTGTVVAFKNYDSDPEPETIVVYTGQFPIECIPNMLTFIEHDPKIQSLIDRSEPNITSPGEFLLAEIEGRIAEYFTSKKP